MRTAATVVLVLLPAVLLAQIIPPPPSSAWLACDGPVSLFCDPAGTGEPLIRARAMDTPYGRWVDATIWVELLDLGGDPVPGYPAEDLWLETVGDDLVLCEGGLRADAPTAPDGRTLFTGAIRCGGFLQGGGGTRLRVGTAHGPVTWSSLADLSLTSTDLDGDLVVTLSDVVIFAQRYLASGYDPSIDYYFDGTINLSDLVFMAEHRNLACPP